jgi:hypothetical protein
MTKKIASSRPQIRPRTRRGIAERGGWVDQRVSEILLQPHLSLPEKVLHVYNVLAAKPPTGDHLPPIEVIRIRLTRHFPNLAEEPDGPLSSQNMPGTVYQVLGDVIQSWSPVKASHKRASRRRDGRASFITYLTNRLQWVCLRHLEQTHDRFREIPISELLRLKDTEDGIDEDYVPDLGFESIAFDELL